MLWDNYALVVQTSEHDWHNQSISIDIIIEQWANNPTYYRIEKWTWLRTEDGDVLQKTEVMREAKR